MIQQQLAVADKRQPPTPTKQRPCVQSGDMKGSRHTNPTSNEIAPTVQGGSNVGTPFYCLFNAREIWTTCNCERHPPTQGFRSLRKSGRSVQTRSFGQGDAHPCWIDRKKRPRQTLLSAFQRKGSSLSLIPIVGTKGKPARAHVDDARGSHFCSRGSSRRTDLPPQFAQPKFRDDCISEIRGGSWDLYLFQQARQVDSLRCSLLTARG